ncbi:MAG: DUF6252 family protein [Cruoricaptor ignavus]|nr:DUF6252 family protein [Cruoricaptor ignavus]
MKKLLLLLGLFSLILISCREDDSDKRVNPNILPEATQNGANTGGALVDGKVWVSSTKRYYRGAGEVYMIRSATGHFSLKVSMRHLSGDSEILIDLEDITPLEVNKKYYFNNNSRDANDYYNTTVVYGDLLSFKEYYYHSGYFADGYLIINRIDFEKRFISGVFEFTAEDENGNTVTITDGRFDKKF